MSDKCWNVNIQEFGGWRLSRDLCQEKFSSEDVFGLKITKCRISWHLCLCFTSNLKSISRYIWKKKKKAGIVDRPVNDDDAGVNKMELQKTRRFCNMPPPPKLHRHQHNMWLWVVWIPCVDDFRSETWTGTIKQQLRDFEPLELRTGLNERLLWFNRQAVEWGGVCGCLCTVPSHSNRWSATCPVPLVLQHAHSLSAACH